VMRRVDVGRFFAAVNPRMAAVITSLSPEGEPNAISATWHSPIANRPPFYGVYISPKRATHDNVEGTGVRGQLPALRASPEGTLRRQGVPERERAS